MQGTASSQPRPPSVLLAETRRVLDAQQRLVKRQRAQATNVVRILLTTAGLVLTLASIAVSVDPGAVDASHWALQWFGVGQLAAFVTLAIITILACRMLCGALVVLEPRTTQQPLVRVLTTPIRASTRPLPPTRTDVSFRSGLDADATTDLSDEHDPVRDVVVYNAGCVAGNALLVEQNRWYLTRIYRSATVSVVLVTLALLFVLVLHTLALPR